MFDKPRHAMFLAVAAIVLTPSTVIAQDVRGTISGRVTDATGSVLVGTVVTIENIATGVTARAISNDAGVYRVPYLSPGEYRITARAEGFRAAGRDVSVRVEDRLSLDFKLEHSGVSESVEVVAASSLLETSTGTSGQVVESKTIAEMPLGDGTAYYLARLAPGVEFTADPKFTRPMDNVNLAGVSASGLARTQPPGEINAIASTNFMLDGVPNHVSQNRLGFSPPSAAVQEFKVSTSVFDAQFGYGGGGTVSLALKSGANDLKGEVSYYNRDESRSANTFFSNAVGREKEARDYHRATLILSGPIQRNKTFFMVSGEYLYDDAPEPLITTVPTERMRRGDFSEYTAVQIFDPATSRLVPDGRGGNRTVRDPFPGNIIPESRIHPIARKVLSYYPLPNLPREKWNPDLTGNYFSDRNRPYDYRAGVLKIDHTLNERNQLFLNVLRNWRMEDRSNWAQAPITQAFDWRSNTLVILGWTSTRSATSVLDVRASAHKFGEWQRAAMTLTAAEFGFGQSVASLARGYPYFPYFDMETYLDIGSQRPGGRYEFDRPHWRYSFLPTFTKVLSSHTLRAGYDFRLIREQEVNEGFKAGRFIFRSGFTNQGTGSTGAATHRDLAALLLGTPTDGNFDTNVGRDNQLLGHGVFVQDDWRVNSRLTLNLGLRWEIETGMREAENRNTRGFDLVSPNPLEAAARARLAADFAANPAAFETASGRYLVTPDSFRVRGGYLFADAEHRDFWRTPRNVFQPRFGIAYGATDKLVVRGGVGLFVTPYTMSGIDQRGFSRSTNVLVADAQGLPRAGVFEDPVPGGLLPPVGSALGLLTDVGNSIGANSNTVVPYEREVQRFTRFGLGFQYELPGRVLFEANYVGSRGADLVVQDPANFLPAEYLIDGNVRDRAKEDFLSATVPNPFRGLPAVAGTSLDRDTISREAILRAYPQFVTFRMQTYDGSNRYDSVQLRVERRFSKGFMVSANYTYARLLETITRLNESDQKLHERVSTNERPHSYKIATIAELPFGKGRKWGAGWSRTLQALFGGWRLSANYLWQSGAPISWGNHYYDPARNPHDLRTLYGKTKDGKRYGIDLPAFDTSGFYFHDAPVQRLNPATGQAEDDPARQIADDRINVDHPRYRRSFPQTIDNMRQPVFHNLDVGLAKTFELGRMRLQVRAEALNAANYAQLDSLETNPRNGNFGKFDQQRNLPRDIQLGVRLTF